MNPFFALKLWNNTLNVGMKELLPRGTTIALPLLRNSLLMLTLPERSVLMKNWFVFGIILSSFILSQGVLAATSTTTETDGQNHVTIVINQNGRKPVTKKGAIKKVAKKPAVKPVTKVVIAPVVTRPYRPLGKRVSLANQGYAHANGYNGTEENQVMPSTTSLPPGPNLVARLKKEEQKEELASPWGIKLRSYNAINMNALENSGPSRDYTVRAWERLSISYNINPDVSIILMPQYYHTWFEDQDRVQSSSNPGYNQSYASYLGDTGLYIEDKNLATFGGSGTHLTNGGKWVKTEPFILGGSQSYFAPTSEASETAGQVGETRTNINLAKSFGKLDLKLTEEFRYYLQQYNTNSFIGTDGKPIANTAYRVLNLMDIGYNFTSKLNFTVESGVVNEYNYGDAPTNLSPQFVDYFVMNPDLGYTFSDHFGLDLGIWEVYNYTNPPNTTGTSSGPTASYMPFAPYNGTDAGSWSGTEVYLMGTVKF